MSLNQASATKVLQTSASATGNGTNLEVDGVTGAIQLEVAETNGGTATVNFEGLFDAANWYLVGYQQVDATASPARAAAALSVLANSRHVYQLLDPYPLMRARISAVATSPSVTVKGYIVGV